MNNNLCRMKELCQDCLSLFVWSYHYENTLRAALLVVMILPGAAEAQIPPPAAAPAILGIFTPQSFVLFLIAAAIVFTTVKHAAPK
jgi:hypothetical protein